MTSAPRLASALPASGAVVNCPISRTRSPLSGEARSLSLPLEVSGETDVAVATNSLNAALPLPGIVRLFGETPDHCLPLIGLAGSCTVCPSNPLTVRNHCANRHPSGELFHVLIGLNIGPFYRLAKVLPLAVGYAADLNAAVARIVAVPWHDH